MRRIALLSSVPLLCALFLAAAPVDAASVCDKCEASVLKAAAKLVQTVFKCHGKHTKRPDQDPPGSPRDPGIPNAQAKFVKACDRAVARAGKKGGTVTLGEAPADMALDASGDVAVFVTDEVYPGWDQQLTADNALRAAILKAAGKTCGKQLAALAKDAKRPDATKLAAARAKARGSFESAVEKAIAKARKGSVAWKGASAADLADGLEALVDGVAGDLGVSLSCTAPVNGKKPRIKWRGSGQTDLLSCVNKDKFVLFRIEGGNGKVSIDVKLGSDTESCTAAVEAGKRYRLAVPLAQVWGGLFPGDKDLAVSSESATEDYELSLPRCWELELIQIPPDISYYEPVNYFAGHTKFNGDPIVEESPSETLAELAGSWRGVLVDPDGTPHEISFVLDDWGNVSNYRLDGTKTGLEATVDLGGSSTRLDYWDSAGVEGEVFHDEGADHIAIRVPNGPIGLLQKGASGLPNSDPGDLVGTLWGKGRRVDAEGKYRSLTQRIRVRPDSTCFGLWSSDETYDVVISGHDPQHGIHSGTVTKGEGQGAGVTLLLSHDKTHATLRTEDPATGTWSFGLLGPDKCLAPFEGSWLGTMQDSNELPHKASFEIDARGNVTSFAVDGSDTGVTAQLNLPEDDYTSKCPDLVACTDSEGTRSWVHLAESEEHLAFWAEDNHFAVLEKGATSLPTFGAADVDGDWSGTGYNFDSQWQPTDEWDESYTFSEPSFTGITDSGIEFQGALDTHDAVRGWFRWDWWDTADPDFDGVVVILLSPDKTFATALWVAPPVGWSFPDDCGFFHMSRDE